MSLLVLVILSLAGFLTVESRLASQGVALRSARLNALAAGRLALAQLQQLAGNDQRVTARADLLDPAATGASRNSGLRLARLNPERRLWTGVWMTGTGGSTRLRAWEPARPDERVFLGWLVSPSPSGEVLSLPRRATSPPRSHWAQPLPRRIPRTATTSSCWAPPI